MRCEAPGFFGKLPSHGDFVSRRFPRALRECWDDWLQAGITASQDHFGPAWDEIWLSSPLWHFALGADVAGGAAVLGVLMPSCDRVGRQFPLTLACTLPPEADLIATVAGAEAWFDAADGLARSALDPAFDLEVFERGLVEALPALDLSLPFPQPLRSEGTLPLVSQLGPPPHDLVQTPPAERWLLWQPLLSGTTLAQGVAAHAEALSCAAAQTCSYWWTEGLPGLPAVLAVQRDLPPAEAFKTLLVGVSA